jgi:ribosome biogenesis GTPase / thiamine phosphate phosphatase
MTLKELGFKSEHEKFIVDNNISINDIGRVIAEHKELYIIKTLNGEFEAEITGNMRFTANGREDFPAVGDWVTFMPYELNFAIITRILPRYSTIKRRAVGQFGEYQIIATNIDYAFVIQSVDRDFSINRFERYLTICNSANVNPYIILSKIDLISEHKLSEIMLSIKERIKNVLIFNISNETHAGYDQINRIIKKGKTYCLLGSSGVGKSTLLNNLSGKSIMKTDSISQTSNRGKHVTSHREMIILNNGGLLIDNPGMREIGITESTMGLEATFDIISNLSKDCKYKDCKHTSEVGCAVVEAVNNGIIDANSYENYQKMEKEKSHYESSILERRKKEKDFGKFLKNYKKGLKKKID